MRSASARAWGRKLKADQEMGQMLQVLQQHQEATGAPCSWTRPGNSARRPGARRRRPEARAIPVMTVRGRDQLKKPGCTGTIITMYLFHVFEATALGMQSGLRRLVPAKPRPVRCSLQDATDDELFVVHGMSYGS